MKKILMMVFCVFTAFVSAQIDEQQATQEKKDRLQATIERAQGGLKQRFEICDLEKRIESLRKERERILIDKYLTYCWKFEPNFYFLGDEDDKVLFLMHEQVRYFLRLKCYSLDSDELLLRIHVQQVGRKDPQNRLVKLILERGRDAVLLELKQEFARCNEEITSLLKDLEAMQS